MKNTRKFYIKLFVLFLILSIVQWKFDIAWPLAKPLHWAALISLILAIAYPVGRPLHWLWEKYCGITTQAMRFFMGTGLVLGGIALYRWHFIPPAEWLNWSIAGGVALLVGLIPPVAAIVFKGWMAIAHLIQMVVSRVILTTIYIIAVIPVGLVAKITGKRFLEKDLDPQATTYWITKEEPSDLKRYHRHF